MMCVSRSVIVATKDGEINKKNNPFFFLGTGRKGSCQKQGTDEEATDSQGGSKKLRNKDIEGVKKQKQKKKMRGNMDTKTKGG